MRALVIIVVIVVRAGLAHGDSVTEELSAGTTISAPRIPATDWIADRIAAVWDASERWSVRADLGLTHVYAGGEPSDVITTGVSIDFAMSERWSFGVTGNWSPQSTTRSLQTIAAQGIPGMYEEADVAIAATSEMGSLALSASYDSLGSWTASGGVGVSRYVSRQAIESLTVFEDGAPGQQTMTPAEMRDRCATMACSPELVAALAPKWSAVEQLAVDSSVTHSEGDDLDFGMSGTIFAYSADPTTLGYFGLATVGKNPLGAGVSVAPLRWSAAPTITKRFGALSATLRLGYGAYLDDGYDASGSVKVAWKTKLDAASRVRLFAKISSVLSVDATAYASASASFALARSTVGDVTPELMRGLAAAIPETEWKVVGNELQGVVRDVDGYFSVRLHAFPFAEIFVQTRKLDGFESALSFNERARTGDHPFERMFDTRTNDEVLTAHWLDDEARRTLVASRYPYHVSDFAAAMTEAKIANMLVYRTWKYELAGDRIVATKGTAEPEPGRLSRAVITACALAGRSQRWAVPYRELARSIGATARSEVELGLTSQPIITAERQGLDVELRLVREIGGTERLRTLIGSRRVGVTGGAWSYVHDDLPRRHRPPLPGKRRDRDDIAEPLKKLFDLVRPDAVVVDDGRVEIWFDGTPMERTRIDVAIELCARWAVDVPTTSGPYR